MMDLTNVNNVLDFWYNDAMSKHWFSSTPAIDQEITQNFEAIWQKAKNNDLDCWKKSADGCLALCIVLDQMPLNMFRNQKVSFSTEQQAVVITKHAIKFGFDKEIDQDKVSFLYMPLMHSENMTDQDLAVQMFKEAELEGNLQFAKHHRGIVEEFGRFPHRNEILGRKSTQLELDYLHSDRAFTG